NNSHRALTSIETSSPTRLTKARRVVIVVSNSTVVNIRICGLGAAKRINPRTYTANGITGYFTVIKEYRRSLVKTTTTIAAIVGTVILFNRATFKPDSCFRKDKHTCGVKTCRIFRYFTIYEIDNRPGHDQPAAIETVILGTIKGNVSRSAGSCLSILDRKPLQDNLLFCLNRSRYGYGMIHLSGSGISTQNRFVHGRIRHSTLRRIRRIPTDQADVTMYLEGP